MLNISVQIPIAVDYKTVSFSLDFEGHFIIDGQGKVPSLVFYKPDGTIINDVTIDEHTCQNARVTFSAIPSHGTYVIATYSGG